MAEGWECLAMHEGGTVVAVVSAASGTMGGNVLFAATATGLFRSDDAGKMWVAASEQPLPLLTTAVPSPRFATNNTLYAGTATGCFRSPDSGRTWRQVLTGGSVFAMATWMGGDGAEHLFVGTESDGILHSDDGGNSWAGANAGLLDLTVLALAFSPDAARDQIGFAATASGLYRTRNGGKSWRAVAWPVDEAAVQCVVCSPSFALDRVVLAGTEADGLWRSDDGGTSWIPVSGMEAGGISAIAFSSPGTLPRALAVARGDGVLLSRDGGETWRRAGEVLPPVLALAFVPDGTSDSLVAGLSRDGIVRLRADDEQEEWHTANTGLQAAMITALSAASEHVVAVAGPDAGLRISRDGGRVWQQVELHGAGTAAVNALAAVPAASGASILFAATDGGIVRSDDEGEHWSGPLAAAYAPIGPIAVAPGAEPAHAWVIAVTADGGLICSGDGGNRWQTCTTPPDGAHIVSLACSPEYAQDRILYAATRVSGGNNADASQRTIWRSHDGGATWAAWLQEPGGADVLPICVPPGREYSVMVGLPGRVLQPRANAWQTRHGARMPLWRATNLPTADGGPASVTSLAASPNFATDGTVFAGTSAGVYRSGDRGRTFGPWHDDMGARPVLALSVIGPRLLVFALGVDSTIWRRESAT
jgi:photosystem II stability/assembly factor-like uncharacterized protein